ncbi:hypothetical protein [Thauera aromatica]|uniref:hypothetical protein n=1 Tax=Thauera aromatica TaxID=59405 RepID=UPI001FFDD7E7|nr:hypothetical protein [Thauera aromatica]MCK2097117.1 hypothetical protein [Thauera aromatica]
MKNARPPKEASAQEQRRFYTDNPRDQRVLAFLLQRPAKREEVDRVAGASNGPDLIAGLRRRGLELPCERIDAVDRDGRPCRPGVYHMTAADRRKVYAWLRRRGAGFIRPELAGLLALVVVAGMLLLGGA